MQSFWTHPELQKFEEYSKKAKVKKDVINDLDGKNNWERGLKKMQQLAIGYGINYNPESPFKIKKLPDPIVWIKTKRNEIVGITNRESVLDHKKFGDYHVFSAKWLEMMICGAKDKKAKLNGLIKAFILFDGRLE